MNSEVVGIILNLVNLVLCSIVGWACLCRLNLLHGGMDWRPRLIFSLLLTGATAHGFGPWLFGDRAGLGDTIMTVAVLTGLLLSAHRWREGAPIGLTAPADFDDDIQGATRL